jgi:hypothetical protein
MTGSIWPFDMALSLYEKTKTIDYLSVCSKLGRDWRPNNYPHPIGMHIPLSRICRIVVLSFYGVHQALGRQQAYTAPVPAQYIVSGSS